MLREQQASLPGWQPALSLRVPGTRWGGLSCPSYSLGTAGLRSWGPAQASLLWAPLQAGPALPSLLPASCWELHPAGSFILLWKRDVASRPSPPSHPAMLLLPVAPRCQRALLTAGAAAGTAGLVLARAPEPLEAAVRIWAGFVFLPSCLFCQQRRVLALFYFLAVSAPSSKILRFSESQPSELKLCIFHVF